MGDQVTFTPTVRYRALASQVLVVATTRAEGAWKAYCDAVPGQNHSREIYEVLAYGDEIGEKLARVLFPEYKDVPYAD